MADLNLDSDEGVIITTENLFRSKNGNKDNVDAMYLTNKNIIFVTSHKEKTGGMFSKSVKIEDVKKVPLSDIKVINGQVLASQQKVDLFDYELQIQYVNGIEQYSYPDGSKKITTQWVNELNRLLGNGQPLPEKKNDFLDGLSGLASNVGTLAGTIGQSVSSAAKQATDTIKEKTAEAQNAKKVEQEQYANAYQAPPVPQFQQVQTSSYGNSETRRQEFAGKVLKCPNCGAVISQTTAICPECGMKITGQAAVSSVQAFENQFMALESQRKKSILGVINVYAPASSVDKQELALIKNFPVPNTVDDVLEFMILATSNIDVKLSKKGLIKKNSSSAPLMALEMPEAISNAWVAKMQQVYQKAEILFPDDPVFAKIKQIYTDKMVELKYMKKEK